MSSEKLQRIIELAAEVGQAKLILDNKNSQIQELRSIHDNQSKSIENLTSNIRELAGQRDELRENNLELREINETLQERLDDKGQALIVLNRMVTTLKKELTTERRKKSAKKKQPILIHDSVMKIESEEQKESAE